MITSILLMRKVSEEGNFPKLHNDTQRTGFIFLYPSECANENENQMADKRKREEEDIKKPGI